ncbi:Protein of uncharacterised function (DUF732) [Mycolicibacterium phlei]|jgi:hypothetical protein|uniref:DUF732 domain-containing protein n=1 Tax=Mycolicibacterium phlei DSM 43239 = CCUG 21000 TaxID=1226750 RepID=A0A5N5UYG8_MYCPH|nr:DUF732 domain-containing protein [Mycolicibacterium phlei]EID09257.1 hypothetical protein MPHLEI_24946 [Mycolicibacterium phlei RIVM601174]KAB7754695.1 hypothetical protein MPHL21000_16270 [Mycolicibacterium phlei DSM 43239 = CCUG 21000]KXW72562.1 hypothetical protein MPHL43072_01930 [Mycolicibacterium phlei DSM 43072]VEG12007.1 Protein of uncharacterised function (DUF732) [Mycobacteroides chelonae]AMO63917.1 hypothetical protein MPHLCCUG_05133 [Mycolicibacterium phlei]
MYRLVSSVFAAVTAITLACASPAAAEEGAYLDGLQDRYQFLTAQQLVSAGHRACTLSAAGVLAPDVVATVMDDLAIGLVPAMAIVSDAMRELC